MADAGAGGEVDAAFYQAVPTVLRGIQKLRVLWPPILTNASFLGQAGAYRQNADEATWSALLQRAQEDTKDADDGFHAIDGAQKKINDAVMRATRLPKSTALVVMNKQLHWRTIVKDAVEALVGEGIRETDAKRYLRQLGHATLSRDRLTELSDKAVATAGARLNSGLGLILRQYAGALLAATIAQFNELAAGDSSDPLHQGVLGSGVGTLDGLEEAVFAAIQKGATGIAEARSLSDAGHDQLPALLMFLARAPLGTKASLGATQSVQRAMEAVVLGRMLAFLLGWSQDTKLAGSIRRADAGTPFQGRNGSSHPTLVMESRATALVAGVVTSAAYEKERSRVEIDVGAKHPEVVETPHVDVVGRGCVPGCFAEVIAGSRDKDGVIRPTYAQIGSGEDWRNLVRQRLRGSFLPVAFGLGLRWSWMPGPEGAVRQVSSCGWFS